MIWVCPTPDATFDIDAHLAGLGPEFANYGCESYHFYETRVIEREMNWKIVIDTFLEPYHFAYLHKNTVGPIFIPNLCLFEPFGLNLRETLPRPFHCRQSPQATSIQIDTLETIPLRDARQRAVKVIGPGVIGTDEAFTDIAATLRQFCATVPANIHEGVYFARFIANDENGNA